MYPAAHRLLWQEVVAAGTLLTEAPLGAAPEAWRFPARNRLIAALSDVLVVVESRAAGGSLLTVDQALRRDVPVMAVPGSIRNPAADGTNQLLTDGAAPVRSVDDILVALGLVEATTALRRTVEPRPPAAIRGAPGPSAEVDDPPPPGERAGERSTHDHPMTPVERAVLDALDDGPTSVDTVVRRCALPVPSVLAVLQRLVTRGLVALDGGRYARVGAAPTSWSTTVDSPAPGVVEPTPPVGE